MPNFPNADQVTAGHVVEFAEHNGPENWQNEINPETLVGNIGSGYPVDAVVVAADIRSSTILMREAVSPILFADTISSFVGRMRQALRERGGWFEKFTGDGFLAYWPCVRPVSQSNHFPQRSYIPDIADFINICLTDFRDFTEDSLRANTRNFPRRVGLSFGVDGGPIYLQPVAGALTILGLPVVGAVRMVSVAEPYEVIVNGYLGSALLRERDLFERKLGIRIGREMRNTKEYPAGQEVYKVDFLAAHPLFREGTEPIRPVQVETSTVQPTGSGNEPHKALVEAEPTSETPHG